MVDDRKYTLARISVDRPVSIVMLFLALLVVGYIAYTRAPLSMFPEGLEHDWLYVNVYWEHASPAEVKRAFLPHSEDVLSALNWVKYLETVCAHGQFHVKLHCRPNTDLDRARTELWEALDRLRPQWPDRVDANVVHWSGDSAEVMWVSVSYEGDVDHTYTLLTTQLRPRLERIPGIANIEIHGPGVNEVVIELDEEKVRSHGVEVAEYVRLLREQNFSLPVGYLRDGGRKLLVRSDGKFHSLEEIRQITLKGRENLRLGDVAAVQLKPEKHRWISRVDRRQLLWLGINRSSSGNLVAISQAARVVFEEVEKLPEYRSIVLEVVWDQGKHVLHSIDNLRSSGLWGGLFAAIVLFLFVRTIRMTLVISSAVPLSILATVITIYFMDWTINSATMLGLMLSLGLVMDNAIVIVENIYHKRESGVEARQASILGAGEVGLAVTMATLTTVVVLLMGVLFESFVLPLSVILSVPFAFLGVFWFLYLTGTSMDFLSQIGTVILIGVVVNNAIVFIDLANRLRAEGVEIGAALIEAGRQRFRPILMTTFTTVCGLIPMAVGNTKVVGMGYAPLGRTIMGGLLASMVLTLVIVPLCYTLFEDLRVAVGRIARSAVSRGTAQ